MRPRPRGRRKSAGQTLVEVALIAPILLLLMLGAADLGRAFYFSIEISGASRAGMRTGILNLATDIGVAVRSESNNAIPNDIATWGSTGPGGVNADCASATQKCGDPSGCVAASFAPGQLACFAIRWCTMSGGTCTAPYGPWASRPGTNQGLQVHVVYVLQALTPLISNFAGSGGVFLLSSDVIGPELY